MKDYLNMIVKANQNSQSCTSSAQPTINASYSKHMQSTTSHISN